MQNDLTVTLDTRLQRAEHAMHAAVGDEVVILLAERSTYFDTNAEGAAIWEALARPVTVREVCAVLMTRFEVTEIDCQRDVLAFVQDGVKEGLIVEAVAAR